MSLLKPDFIFNRAADISVDFLMSRGVQGIILDLDGTVCPTRGVQADEACEEWLHTLTNYGIKIYLLSNNRHIERVRAFCESYGIELYSNRAAKPFRRGFLKAAAELAVPYKNIAVIGDQIYTDVLGGNRLGMQTFFVFSSDYSIWYIRLRHLLELPFLRGKRQSCV